MNKQTWKPKEYYMTNKTCAIPNTHNNIDEISKAYFEQQKQDTNGNKVEDHLKFLIDLVCHSSIFLYTIEWVL